MLPMTTSPLVEVVQDILLSTTAATMNTVDEAPMCACGERKVYTDELGWHCSKYWDEAAELINYYTSGQYWDDKDNASK